MQLFSKLRTKATVATEMLRLTSRMASIEDQNSMEYQECLDRFAKLVAVKKDMKDPKNPHEIVTEVIKTIGVIGTLLIVVYHEDIANKVLGGKAFQVWSSKTRL